MQKVPKILASSTLDAGSDLGLLRRAGQEIRAQSLPNPPYLKIDYFTIFWLFIGGCIIGLIVETLFHFIVYGGYESRVGLVWGPFSPLYGVGAVLLTLVLNRFYHSHNLVIFLMAMIVGSILEYGTSWGMEHCWGAVAWDYSGTFGSIQGRTNFAFGMMWGMLGLVWVRIILPFIKRAFLRIDAKNAIIRALTVAASVFMAINITITVLALNREGQRADGIPATTWEQHFLDEHFPHEYLQARMENMSINGRG